MQPIRFRCKRWGPTMKSAKGAVALVLSAIILAGCQYSGPRLMARTSANTPSPIDGTWASGDGVSVTSFNNGRFTTRFTQTNEVLAEGTYLMRGGQATMQWVSIAAQEQRSAVCSFSAANTLRCAPAQGDAFTLTRSA